MLHSSYRGLLLAAVIVSFSLASCGKSDTVTAPSPTSSWTQVSGLSSITALELAGTSLLAGTDGGGIRRSTDQGHSWPVAGAPGTTVFVFAVSPPTVLAGTDIGLFRSSDGGATWSLSALSQQRLGFTVDVTALLPDGAELFAGTGSNGLYHSMGGGASWVRIATPYFTGNEAILGLARNGSILFAGTSNANQVFRSTDHGTSWRLLAPGMGPAGCSCLLVRGTRIFAGTTDGRVFLSDDNGNSWAPRTVGTGDIVAMASSGDHVFAATSESGVHRSDDNGDTWQAMDNGLIRPRLLSIAADGSVVLAGTFGGSVYLSQDQGGTWAAVHTGIAATTIYSLAATGTSLWAGSGEGNVFRSSDEGKTWIARRIATGVVSDLALHGGRLFAGMSGVSGTGIYRSDDGGDTWTATGLAGRAVGAIAVGEASIFASTDNGDVFRSDDDGRSWVGGDIGPVGEIFSLALMGSTVFAGGIGAVYRSDDGGGTWTGHVVTSTPGVEIIQLVVEGPHLFAAGALGIVYRSDDGGATWVPVATGLCCGVTSLASSGSCLVAGTESGKTFRSCDDGATWTEFGSTGALASDFVTVGTTIFAGALGVWRSAMPVP